MSLLQTVPKRPDSSKLGLDDDLSFLEGVSVNSGIPKDSYLNHEIYKLVLLGIDAQQFKIFNVPYILNELRYETPFRNKVKHVV